jgi:hypothetical protein
MKHSYRIAKKENSVNCLSHKLKLRIINHIIRTKDYKIDFTNACSVPSIFYAIGSVTLDNIFFYLK